MILKDIHDYSFEEKAIREVNGDIKRLVKRSTNFAPVDCPACTGNDKADAYDLLGLKYNECNRCGTVFLSPCPDLHTMKWYWENSKSLKTWREEMPVDLTTKRMQKLYAERINYIEKQVVRFGVERNRFLDVGGGNAELAGMMASMYGFNETEVIEPQYIKSIDPRVKWFQGPIEEYPNDRLFDVICLFEVIEHIISPRKMLSKIRGLLSEHGIFVLSSPNFHGYETQTLSKRSRALWFDHVALYNPVSLRILLENTGFQVLDLSTPGKLDIELIHHEYKKCGFKPKDDALRFILEGSKSLRYEFQSYLAENGKSSHMRCVAKRNGK